MGTELGLEQESATSSAEQDFWTSPPSYPAESLPPSALLPERPPPSARRLLIAKLVFGGVLSGVLVLLGYALSLELGIAGARAGEPSGAAR